ncbi:uncharacterized protein LOC134258848, partial [Saccostrea cucullata]|uniref:uncharacterized protein LOC134258848 n=1 Tax=Saccostrea cuccullata TaxID=36930 RepID=UPI002ED10005
MSATWIDILLLVAIVAQTQSSVGSIQAPTAFTKGQTIDVHVSNGENILYNKRITEIGASFDSEGSFVCQTPGLYAFTFYGLTAEDSRLWLEMMKTDELIASIFGHTKNDYADSGNAAIVHLNTGDKVYVKAHNNYNHALFGRADQIYTTITGELLFADNIELDVENFYGPVGFSAILTKHASVSGGSAVIYDKAFTNIGSAYNTTTGTFTAPVEGTYLFHFHALAYENTDFWLELFHNENYVISSYGYTEGSYADAGNTAVLHLKKGDIVKTNARLGTTARLYGASNELYTTFCGALLSPTVKKTV